MQGLLHDLGRDAGDLDVHLDGGHAVTGSRDLEVHVAQVVLVAEDVRQHEVLVTFLDQAHGDAGDGRLDGHARIHEGQGAAADRGHGGRTVGLHDVGHDADGEGETVRGGQHRGEGALGQGAVADFAAGRGAQHAGLADAVRREIVVHEETPGDLAGQGLDALLVAGAAQGACAQGLGLAAGEDGRAVGAGQEAHFHGQGADRGQVAAVDAELFGHDALAHELLLELLQDLADVAHALGRFGEAGHERFHELLADLLLGVAAVHLAGHGQGRGQRAGSQFGHGGDEFLILLRGDDGEFVLAEDGAQFLLDIQEGGELGVAPGHGLGHDVLGQELGSALDHDHGVARSGQDHVQLAGGQLGGSGVQQELTVAVADADGRDGAGEGDVGDVQGRGRADHGQDVGVALLVRGDDGGDDLDLIGAALGEERTDGPVDEPGGQGLVFARAANFAAEVVARHAAGRVEHFLIVAGQGQEVHDPVQGLVGGRDQDDGVAPLYGNGAAGLQGQFAVFDDDFAVAHGDGAAGGLKCHGVPHAGWALQRGSCGGFGV
ncbi:hypothetical protein DSECCO2_439870 [anaerobic digester metagenome]